ncbi:LptF/LptG family permease [Microcoleus sp. FACHB-831]|nr:LptF/LptG family permease [Microcoleus sp. FACHB-831]
MDRYIAAELIMPFLFGVCLFSSVVLSVGVLFDLMRKVTESGLMMTVALQVLLLKLPQFVLYAFPMSTLLAALMTYSRLSSDSELIALRSCGVSIYRLIMPAVVLSFIVTGITFLFNERVVPAANYQANLTLDQALKKDKPDIRESNFIFPEYRRVRQPNGERTQVLTRLLYAQEVDGRGMKGLTILDWSQEGLNQIVTAQSAIWNLAQNTWDFYNGTIYLVSPDASYRNIVKFAHQQLQLPRTPLDLASQRLDYTEMNIDQLKEDMKLVRLSGDFKKVRKHEVRLQERYAFPFVCLVFGLLGSALGSRPQRTGKATSFGITVVIVLAYYSLATFSSSFGLMGILPPWMAAWTANVFGFGAGGFLLWRRSVR